MFLTRKFIPVSVCFMIVCALMGCSDDVLPDTPEIEVRNLPSALEAISEAVEKGKVVKSVLPITSGNVGWEVRFLDDTSIRFNCTNDGAIVPYITIGSDSCWLISRDYGEFYSHLTDSVGNHISAINYAPEQVLTGMVLHQQKDTNVLIEALAEDNLSHTLTIALGGGNTYFAQNSKRTHELLYLNSRQ